MLMANLVANQIAYAYKNGIPFLGTGGGHGYSATLGTVENGIEIDLGHFNTFSIDSNANTITVGGSVHFANITGPLYDAGKEWRTLAFASLIVPSLKCVYRSRFVLLRRHGGSYTRWRRWTLWWLAWSTD